MKKIKIIFYLTILTFLFGCSSSNVHIMTKRTIVEECRGALVTRKGTEVGLDAIKVLDARFGANFVWREDTGYDILNNANLKTDAANLEALKMFYQCRNDFYSNPVDTKEYTARDISPIDRKYVTVEGRPMAIKDKFLGMHHNDWNMKYSIVVTNRSPYDVVCKYKISSCSFHDSSCNELVYDMYVNDIKIQKGSAKSIDDNFDFEYNKKEDRIPVYTDISCISDE